MTKRGDLRAQREIEWLHERCVFERGILRRAIFGGSIERVFSRRVMFERA